MSKIWYGACGCEDCSTSDRCHSSEAQELRDQLAEKDREIEKLRAELKEALWNEQSSATAYGKLRAAAGGALKALDAIHQDGWIEGEKTSGPFKGMCAEDIALAFSIKLKAALRDGSSVTARSDESDPLGVSG